MENPYKKSSGFRSPLILKVPLYDFESGETMEAELEPEELCIARMANTTQPTGYTHHVALVYKSKGGEVFSMTMAQHHGDIKPGTLEAMADDPEDTVKELPQMKGQDLGSDK